jgi:hypothetical protein
MVNDTFRNAARYGFEKVHAKMRNAASARCINEKFTPNSMIGIFRKFSTL